MSRALTGTIYYPNGTAWASGEVRARLMEPFETSTRVYPKTEITITLDANGQIPAGTQLDTPDTGTAHYVITTPDQANYHVYIATGAAVDLVTLLTIAGTAVAQDPVQTALDAAEIFPVTAVTTTYAAQSTDVYLRCTDAPYTVTLPAASAFVDGQPIYIKNKSTSAYITVSPAGTNTIDGTTADRTIMPTWGAGFVSDGVSDWDIMGGVA